MNRELSIVTFELRGRAEYKPPQPSASAGAKKANLEALEIQLRKGMDAASRADAKAEQAEPQEEENDDDGYEKWVAEAAAARAYVKHLQAKIHVLKNQPDEGEPPDELLRSLNEQALVAAQRVERELRKNLPPHISTDVMIQFEAGSLILAGTVSLLSWAGPIVMKAANSELEEQLGRLVRSAVQRVIQPLISGDFGFMKLEALSPAAAKELPSNDNSSTSTTERKRKAPLGASLRPQLAPSLLPIYLLVAMLGIGQLVLFLDRYVEITFKEPPQARQATPNVASTVQSLTPRP